VQPTHIKEMIRNFWNKRADSYDKVAYSTPWEWAKYAWKGLLVEVLGNRKLRVLDVETGTGFIALLLAELGHEVIGVDISEGMLRIAREKARKLNIDNVEFRLADAEELPFPDNTFDAVIARHVVWTLSNIEKAYSE